MKILVDGMNFELQSGTGIKTYSRSVVAALSNQGHEIDLLSQQSIKSIKHVTPLAGYLAEMAPRNNTGRIGLREKIFSHVTKIGLSYKGNIDLTDNANIDVLSKLHGEDWQLINGLKVSPGLFLKSFARARLGLGITKVPKARNSEVLFLTSPIPIYLHGKVNILTIHDVIPLSHPWLMNRWSNIAKAIGNTLEYTTSKADKIICVSETTRQELLNRFNIDERKLHVVYQPCRFSLGEQSSSKEADAEVLEWFGLSNAPYILFVGAIEPKKNLLNLLRAMQLNKSLPQLIVIGKFAWSCEQEKVMISELKRRVRHLGFLADHELNILHKNASAFVFPSIVEGFGLPVLEALWNGVPCVISDIPVFRELFLNHAHFIDPYSPAAIAKGIVRALDSCINERKLASEYVQSKFSFKKFKGELGDIIQS